MKRHAADRVGRLVVVDGRPSHYLAYGSGEVTPDDMDRPARAS
jgi:hypothetical protein